MYKKFKHILWKLKEYIEASRRINKAFSKTTNKKRIILIGSPEHGNLGDHAISVAEMQFFKDKIPEFETVEISGYMYRKAGNYLKKLINSNDIIAITGGGFIGDIWMEEEFLVRSIIENFSENKIIVMPQTIFFCDDIGEERELFIRACNNHSNLHITCRDRASYLMAKNDIVLKNVYYVPDIVLYLKPDIKKVKSNHISVCFREDRESSFADDNKQKIFDFLEEKEFDLKFFSTIHTGNVSLEDREERLKEIFENIASSKLVITDRLHAMIFSTITSTPCIAIDNISGKVSGVYAWIRDQEYIKFAKSNEEFEVLFDDIMSINDFKVNYDKKSIERQYEPLVNLFVK